MALLCEIYIQYRVVSNILTRYFVLEVFGSLPLCPGHFHLSQGNTSNTKIFTSSANICLPLQTGEKNEITVSINKSLQFAQGWHQGSCFKGAKIFYGGRNKCPGFRKRRENLWILEIAEEDHTLQ